MQKRIALILSGSGHLDGSEITEAVSSLIVLSELKAEVSIFAPNSEADASIHISSASLPSNLQKSNLVISPEKRNILLESARIARGAIQSLDKLNPENFDALVLPGGYGAAKNLSDFASHSFKAKILPELKNIILAFHSSSKPIAAICIAPHLLALALKGNNICISLGAMSADYQELQNKWGCDIVECAADDYVTDRENKIICTPAYMYNSSPFTVYTGIRKALFELIEMA